MEIHRKLTKLEINTLVQMVVTVKQAEERYGQLNEVLQGYLADALDGAPDNSRVDFDLKAVVYDPEPGEPLEPAK